MRILAKAHPVAFLQGLLVVAFALLLAIAVDARSASAGGVDQGRSRRLIRPPRSRVSTTPP